MLTVDEVEQTQRIIIVFQLTYAAYCHKLV